MLNFVCNVLVNVTKFFLLKRSYFVCIIEIDKEKFTSDCEGKISPNEAGKAFYVVSQDVVKNLKRSVSKPNRAGQLARKKDSHGK